MFIESSAGPPARVQAGMDSLLLRPGARLRVRFPGESRALDAVLDRILDSHGRRLDVVDLAEPPHHAMLVVHVDGVLHCVPLWQEAEGLIIDKVRRAS